MHFFSIQQNFQILLKTNHPPSAFAKMTKVAIRILQAMVEVEYFKTIPIREAYALLFF